MKSVIGLFAALLISQSALAKYNVCSITLNSSNEINTFKQQLGTTDFNFIELTKFADDDNTSKWFNDACSKNTASCDVLIISGHFGGEFFGENKLELSLGLKTINQKSCDGTCTNIFKNLKEVYLFGCNTLAGKTKDHRTPEQYLAVLRDDGISAIEAQRIVATRYGPFGSSFADQMSRAFENTPIIYGFDGVAPSGANIQTSLRKYLLSLGNYKTHLERKAFARSSESWMSSMNSYNRSLGKGIKPTDAGYDVRQNMCLFSDENKSADMLLDRAMVLLNKEPLVYLPTIASFFTERVSNNLNAATKAKLAQLKNQKSIETRMYQLIESPGVLLGEKVEYYNMMKTVGWMNEIKYKDSVKKLISAHLAQPTRANTDVLCSLLDDNYKYQEMIDKNILLNYAFNKKEHYEIVSCSGLEDEQLTIKMTQGFAKNSSLFKGNDIWSIAFTVAERSGGYRSERFQILSAATKNAPFTSDLSYYGGIENLKRMLLSTIGSADYLSSVLSYIEKNSTNVSNDLIINQVVQNSNLNDAQVVRLLHVPALEEGSISDYNFIARSSTIVQDEIAKKWPNFEGFLMKKYILGAFSLNKTPIKSENLRKVFISEFIQNIKLSQKPETSNYFSWEILYSLGPILGETRISLLELADIYIEYKRSKDEMIRRNIRHILYKKNGALIFKDTTISSDTKFVYECAKEDPITTSCSTRQYTTL